MVHQTEMKTLGGGRGDAMKFGATEVSWFWLG